VKTRPLLTLACLLSLSATACKPQTPAEPDAAPAVAPVTVQEAPTVAAPPVTDTSSSVAPTFDRKAFAGTFKGILPCTDCSGVDTALELRPDGTYAISETYQGKAGGAKMQGTWTVEASDQHLRLDPDSKSEADRVFAIASNEQIAPVGQDGQPAAGSQGLHRDGAGLR